MAKMALIAESERLAIRDWAEADAEAALEIFGSTEVARRLAPELGGARRRSATSRAT
jgi:hypothetical protein